MFVEVLSTSICRELLGYSRREACKKRTKYVRQHGYGRSIILPLQEVGIVASLSSFAMSLVKKRIKTKVGR